MRPDLHQDTLDVLNSDEDSTSVPRQDLETRLGAFDFHLYVNRDYESYS